MEHVAAILSHGGMGRLMARVKVRATDSGEGVGCMYSACGLHVHRAADSGEGQVRGEDKAKS